MFKGQNTIYVPLSVICKQCGKETKVNIPYVCEPHEFPCNEIYLKSRIEQKNIIYGCSCSGIQKQLNDEYMKEKLSYEIQH